MCCEMQTALQACTGIHANDECTKQEFVKRLLDFVFTPVS